MILGVRVEDASIDDPIFLGAQIVTNLSTLALQVTEVCVRGAQTFNDELGVIEWKSLSSAADLRGVGARVEIPQEQVLHPDPMVIGHTLMPGSFLLIFVPNNSDLMLTFSPSGVDSESACSLVLSGLA